MLTLKRLAVGTGACDNPDVLDKEAGALALRAFITLYQATTDDQWVGHSLVTSFGACFVKKPTFVLPTRCCRSTGGGGAAGSDVR